MCRPTIWELSLEKFSTTETELKIVRREVTRGGSDIIVAFIDTEGLDLGIDTLPPEPYIPQLEEGYTTIVAPIDSDGDAVDAAEIEDPEDTPILDNTMAIVDLNKIYFYIDTYVKLSKPPADNWELLLRPANGFLNFLNAADQKLFCLFYIEARRYIDSEFMLNNTNMISINDVATQLGNRLYDLARAMDLPAKLIYYAANPEISGIIIPDLSQAGTRPQDNEQYTFRYDEYIVVVAISILCKLLCPIWGDLIQRTLKNTANAVKETHCLKAIEPILDMPAFAVVNKKLFGYIANIVNQEWSRASDNAGFTASLSGFSRERFHDMIYAILMVKRYVNIDHYKYDGSVMVWTATNAKLSFTSLIGTLNNNCHIMRRVDVSDSPDRDDDRAVSVLEYSSRVTTVTADIPTLIKVGMRAAIRDLCRTYDVAERDFRLCLRYYEQHPIEVTLLNKILVGLLIGQRIGGARGLQYLDLLHYMQLVVIVQIHLVKQGYLALAELLTATPAATVKTGVASNIDSSIHQLLARLPESKEVEHVFYYTIDNIGVVDILRKLAEFITRYHHYANTAPTLAAVADQELTPPDQVVGYDEFIMRTFCEVIKDALARENQQSPGG